SLSDLPARSASTQPFPGRSDLAATGSGFYGNDDYRWTPGGPYRCTSCNDPWAGHPGFCHVAAHAANPLLTLLLDAIHADSTRHGARTHDSTADSSISIRDKSPPVGSGLRHQYSESCCVKLAWDRYSGN